METQACFRKKNVFTKRNTMHDFVVLGFSSLKNTNKRFVAQFQRETRTDCLQFLNRNFYEGSDVVQGELYALTVESKYLRCRKIINHKFGVFLFL